MGLQKFFTVICGVVIASGVGRADAEPPDRPNFVIIMVDDLGYEGVSCFGNPYFKTPEIDRLAAEGMRLVDFHSSGTVCSPTRAGLLTGRYQQRAGIEAVIHPSSEHPEHRKGLQLSERTFAELLSEAGYTTGLIGKWHQGYTEVSEDFHPDQHGFHEFVGYHSGNIDFVSHIGDHGQHDWWYGRQETRERGYTTHLINRMSRDFIRRHAQEDRPFCLYVAHEAVHNPVQVPGDPVRRSETGWDRWKWREVSQEERIAKYKGMTMAMDKGVGEIRSTLKELNLDQNTFVLFFSDNGPSADFPSGSPDLRGAKGSVYEGGHKVPAIAWWPGKIEASSATSQTLISLDVMPTLLSMAGVSPDAHKPLDGVDMSAVLLRNAELAPRSLYWASLSNSGSRSEAMREGTWKLVVKHPMAAPGTFENEKVELFDLSNDPKEEHDLSGSLPDRAQEMKRALTDWYAATQASATKQEGGWLEPVAKEEPKSVVVRDELVESISKVTLEQNRDGHDITWFHPRGCVFPAGVGNEANQRTVLMNLQEISGSDYFGPVHWTVSKDGGNSWGPFEAVPSLGRIPVDGHPGLEAGVCDVTPQYHPQTDTVLALGHVVFYRGPKFSRGDQLARYPVYAVRRADGTWSERKILKWDDPRGAFIYSNNCGQRVVLPDGDILMAFTFGPEANNRRVCGVRCSFDGEELKIKQVGPELRNDVGRGLLEPSVTAFGDQYWMTIRAEDGRGYVAVSDDGLNYSKQPWAFEDGQLLSMSTTQQHWLTHSDGLYLVYTRQDPMNENVIRWRSPLWMARVDTSRQCLIRSTERVVLPMVGDGVGHADAVALMGNFDVTNISAEESWVSVGEWLPRRGARGNLLLAKIRWARPNRLVGGQ